GLATDGKRRGRALRMCESGPGDFHSGSGGPAPPQQRLRGREYNYRPVDEPEDESPGLSVFAIGEQGEIFHTDSTYSRGLDPINSGYQLLDLTPRGRDEDDLPWTMAWVRRHDSS